MILCSFLIAYSVIPRAETGTVTGTAFTVSSDGHLLTDYHVIEGCKSVEVIRSKSIFGVLERKAVTRDLMSPDTEPTDEERHLVMKETLELAMERKKLSDEWMQQRLIEEVELARARQEAVR